MTAYKPLPEGASVEQLLHAQHELAAAYASVAFALTSELPGVKTVLGEIRTELAADRVEKRRIDGKLDELGLGIGRLETAVHHVTGRVAVLEVLAAKIPSVPPPKIPSVPPMRRAQDTGSFILETSRRVGEAAREKAQQIADDPHTDLTPDVVGDIARAEAKVVFTQEREAQRTEALQALADKVATDALEAVELAKTRAREKRDTISKIVIGVAIGTAMLIIGALFTFAQGRATGHGEGFAERAAAAPPVILPVLVPPASVGAPPAPPAAATGTVAPAKK